MLGWFFIVFGAFMLADLTVSKTDGLDRLAIVPATITAVSFAGIASCGDGREP